MTFITENWILILIALSSGGMLLFPLIKAGTAGGGISTNEAVRLVNREKGMLIDVSEPAEYAASHAGGARNLPLGQIDEQIGSAGAKKGLPSNKALPIVVLCPTGTRAGKAVALLKKAGYENAQVLSGGTAAWREASLPIEKAA
jgi:rhodanese-related sulfurtransferase